MNKSMAKSFFIILKGFAVETQKACHLLWQAFINKCTILFCKEQFPVLR